MKYVEPKQNPLLCSYTIFKGWHNSQLSNDYTGNLGKVNQKLSKRFLCRPFVIPTFFNTENP